MLQSFFAPLMIGLLVALFTDWPEAVDVTSKTG
ncbi:hypothetical protein IMAU30106_01567 [Lactiplantibacillus plantarum]|nr:hypothetical protein [Lactiplantibacillus plantarum]MCG0818298.1 hypothetical protein [Lactiplantibacillus plantarum]MCG0937914.1 hypothetical protein [Lactiplantibacillus plantarum]MCG0947427.1 hypothetical protein [Lactiplantibacillus plantarum]